MSPGTTPQSNTIELTRLGTLVQLSERVARESGRRAKIGLVAELLRGVPPEDAAQAAFYLAGELARGPLGVGPAQVREAIGTPPAAESSLTLTDLDRALAEIAAISGAGSQSLRRDSLAALFARATAQEQSFLARLILGELRQGAVAGLVLEAIAQAAGIPAERVRRAAMLCGDLARVTRAALAEGAAGLGRIGLALFRPILPMLAQPAEGLEDALARIPAPYLEYKLDGARIQVHKQGSEVRAYSRQGNEVTAAVPEIAELVAPLPDPDLVLDGEVLALRPDGRPRPFQDTMRRFGRRLDVDAMRHELPLQPVFFDCLERAGAPLIDSPARERFQALADAVPPVALIPRLVPASPAEAQAFLERAFALGHEGLMAKSPDAPYEAGGRGAHWLKIKQAHHLDLVVLAAEWGSGRRRPWLSNLHLGARDGAGGFVMLGKTFKGLTDAMLAWQTERLLSLEIARDGAVVHVRPELVVEIAFNELQESPRYPGGLALRFARVRRHRPDKTAEQADDMVAVRALFARQVAYGGGGAVTEA